jgi:hypothetical protein
MLDFLAMAIPSSLQGVAQADASWLAGAAALSAIAFHVAIQAVEFERYIFIFSHRVCSRSLD